MHKNNMMDRVYIVLLSAIIGLMGWLLFTVHVLSMEMSSLTQFVKDGKELRVQFQNDTIDTLDKIKIDLSECKSRIAVIENKISARP